MDRWVGGQKDGLDSLGQRGRPPGWIQLGSAFAYPPLSQSGGSPHGPQPAVCRNRSA